MRYSKKEYEKAAQRWVKEFMIPVPRGICEKIRRYSGNTDFYDVTPYAENETADYDGTYNLPMWTTMWAMTEQCDDEWIAKHLKKVKKCGFAIFYSEDYGYVLAIDGQGYDFYEEHWIPLYKARGLRWHIRLFE